MNRLFLIARNPGVPGGSDEVQHSTIFQTLGLDTAARGCEAAEPGVGPGER